MISTHVKRSIREERYELKGSRTVLKRGLGSDAYSYFNHFPGWSRKLHCRSILVQIRFHRDSVDQQERLIGLETAGFNHNGQAWQLSTIDNWQFVGKNKPSKEVRQKLKNFCLSVFDLFQV